MMAYESIIRDMSRESLVCLLERESIECRYSSDEQLRAAMQTCVQSGDITIQDLNEMYQ